MSANSEIILGLQKALLTNAKIELMNVYRGVPVLYPATLQAVTDDSAILRASTYASACLELERHTFILCHQLEEAVGAQVETLDLKTGQV